MASSYNTTSTIRIYPSFTEVRQNIKTTAPHKMYVPQDLYNQIMGGSLNLEGVNIHSMNAVLKENDLEGKIIYINKDKQTKKVLMVRSRDSLVQDLDTKRYFHVDRSQIEFLDVPEETGTEVTFALEKEGPAVLSYLMYGINWKPRYSLNISGDNLTFQGWADINNNTLQEYSVEKTELFGGDVNVSRPQFQHRAMACEMMMDSAPRSAPKVEAAGEVAGLYMYNIPDRYVLAPRSTFSLPFVQPKIAMTRVATMGTYFSQSNSKGQSGRVYRISSSDFLPNGSVTVREDGRVVGQSNIPDLAAEEKTDLNVGNDPDVSYERTVKTISNEEAASVYNVNVTVKNKKARQMTFEYTENFGGRYELKTEDPNVKTENETIKSEGALDANGTKSFQFTVKFLHDVCKPIVYGYENN